MKEIKSRFAPSPTGFVHIGSLRTALYNYLFAKKNKGTFLLRVEDTDRTRLVEGAIESMIDSLAWAGIAPDEGVCLGEDGHSVAQKGELGSYIQSERLDIYRKYVDELVEKGHAYYCFCTKERLDTLREEQAKKKQEIMYDGFCKKYTLEEAKEKIKNGEPYVIRMNVPKDKDITFKDLVRGEVTINSNNIDDQVLLKSDGYPTYHLAVVVDDHLMNISHIIRGEEWLTSTPKHVLLYDMFGWEAPTFVHLPNILNKDRKKLSKRQGDVAVEDFIKKGYLPEGLVNYIALLGWSPTDNKEFFTMDELIDSFELDRVSSSGGIFDVEKLNWVNSHYIKNYDIDKLVELTIPFLIEDGVMTEEETVAKKDWIKLAVEVLRERIDYLKQFPSFVRKLSETDIEFEAEALEFMKLPHMKQLFEILNDRIEKCDSITSEFVDELFKELKKEGIKGKNLFMGIRVLISGENHGPDLPKLMMLLGKENILNRLSHSKQYL